MTKQFIAALLLLSACHTARLQTPVTGGDDLPKSDELRLYDSTRNRAIPVGIMYHTYKGRGKQPVVVFNHGYGSGYSDYNSILGALEGAGYFVVAIQHELPTDAPMPTTGEIMTVRKPYWQRGVDIIRFVINNLKQRYPNLAYDSLILIGHSNGGDMSMLFAHQYPKQVSKVISLDNRRMPFPRTGHPRIYSLRSSDQPADAGVLPSAEEAKKYHMEIVALKNTTHNEMNDSGTAEQQRAINNYILQFLND